MAKTLKDLALWASKAKKDIAEAGSQVAIELAEKMVAELVEDTPVDTSLALSNWQASVDRASDFSIPAYAKGRRGSTAAQSRNMAKTAAEFNIFDKKPGQPIYINHNLEYIEDLNNSYNS